LSDRHSYISYFETSGEWQQIEIPLNKMFASFRGQKLNIPDFAAETIAEISVLIGNETAESFALEISKIELK
jgi:NADH dehydrogenase [ubiquinone] 1 alpha subcomplex assembly factor 1